MKSKKEYKKNSAFSLLNKIIALSLAFMVALPTSALADPVIGETVLPPASFTHVQDYDTLVKIGLDGNGTAWCYDDHANALLITAASQAQARCELKLKYEVEKEKAKCQFEIEKLNIRVQSLLKQHQEINLITDNEIQLLTAAAMKRPNDYSAWWATGGVLTGIVATLLVVYVAK